MHTITFTAAGLEKTTKEYDDLLSKRPAVVAELSRARDMGDRSENAAYKSARSHLSALDRRIRYLKKTIDNARVVLPTQTEYVDIGHTVTLRHEGAQIRYTIVGGHESDVITGKISCYSPIGKALLRKQKGVTVQVQVPAGVRTYTILDIAI